ncbi:MAG TPA: RHS repeat-associated core domain-containing protein [Candidatus Dormibacteraeota bacterium]|nr:RHS repeat-associated core domain-containing protein [Candidatus Dormibacteraeota bacterium]
MRIGSASVRAFVCLAVLFSIEAPGLLASFNPPSAVTYNAAAYASRAGLKNSTGFTSLATYASPASCPIKVNLFSEDVSYSALVLGLRGRAGLDLSLTISYNSKAWIKNGNTIYFDGDKGWPSAGWRLGFGRIDGVYAGTDGYNHYYLTLSDGSIHDLRYNGADSLYESIDSTYFDFNDSTGILRQRDGTQFTFALIGGTGGYVLPIQVKDRNGNYITINYSGTGQNISSIVDTVGRTISFTYNGDGTLATISKTGFGGAARTWNFGYSNVTLNYSFSSTLTINAPTNGSAVKMLSSITYPNGTQATFQYNGYAQLIEVDMLSNNSTLRGKYLVGWQTAPSGGWTDSPVPSQVGNFDGSTTNNWILAFNTYSTTVTDPASVPRTTTFLQTGGWDDGLPNQTQIGSPVLETFQNAWGNDGNSINQRITSVTTTLNDTSQQFQVQTDYTTYGNIQEVRDYDYGLTTLLRKTHTTYITGANYTTRHILNLPSTVVVYDGTGTAKANTAYTYDGGTVTSATGASNHDDTNYGTGFLYRGFITLLTQYSDPVTPSGAITHNKGYDMVGNLRTETADCCIQKQYNFSSTTQFSQPDSVIRGSGTTLTTSTTYDSNTGLVASSTDENNQVTNYNYDVADRMTSTTRPDNTVLSTSYDDAAASPSLTDTTPIASSTSKKKITLLDGLGRQIRITIEDASAAVYTKLDTVYDGLGRVSQVGLPYTGSGGSYWIQKQYDGLGRITKEIPPDGSISSNNYSYSYLGNALTSTDYAGNQIKQKADALGRSIETDEPDPANGNTLTLVTSYVYDPMGQNTKITQGVQTRTFVFDGLSRKTSEATPEAGTVSYVYNNYSLVSSKTDARGVVTTFTYDPSLNRISQISYTTTGTTAQATPSVSYSYGTSPTLYNNGSLITMTDGVGSERYSYDQLGRRTQVQKVINNVTYTIGYSYNLANELVNRTYPSGRVVKNGYDAIGRLLSLQNNSTSAYYLSNASYNAASQPTAFTYGNNVSAAFGYSAQRYQLSSLSYVQGSTTLFGLTYGYTQNGGNNGQITGITDTVDSGRTENYTFDALHRLSTAVTGGSTNYPKWGLSWTYDRYGNRIAQTVTAGSAYSSSLTADPNTNHVTAIGTSSLSYDSSGNLTQDDQYKYVYDAENRLVQLQQLNGSTIATYSMDGNGTRVIKVVGTSRTYSVYDGKNLISEFSDTSTTTYTAGTTPQQAPADSVSILLYHHSDHLTTRSTTDNFGNAASLEGHYPYGESWYETGTASPSVPRKFTTYSKDTEASNAMLNYALARQHSARIGRFQMPDPVMGKHAGPQKLNRYAYVGGDPISRIDPRGFYYQEWPTDDGWSGCRSFWGCGGGAGGGGGICIDIFGFLIGDCNSSPSAPPPPSACAGAVNPVDLQTFHELIDCSHGDKKIHQATAQVIGFREGVIVTSITTDSDSTIQLEGGPTRNELAPLIFYQNYRTNLGGSINWRAEWTCDGNAQTPLEATTIVDCNGGIQTLGPRHNIHGGRLITAFE